jgi:hypothetical protein
MSIERRLKALERGGPDCPGFGWPEVEVEVSWGRRALADEEPARCPSCGRPFEAVLDEVKRSS